MKRHLIKVVTLLSVLIISLYLWLGVNWGGDLATPQNMSQTSQPLSKVKYSNLAIKPESNIGPFSVNLFMSAKIDDIYDVINSLNSAGFGQTPHEVIQVRDESDQALFMLLVGEFNELTEAQAYQARVSLAFDTQAQVIRLPIEVLTSVSFLEPIDIDESDQFRCHHNSYNWDYAALIKATSYFQEYKYLKKRHGWDDKIYTNSIFHKRAQTELKSRILELLNQSQKTYQGNRSSAELFAMLDVSENQVEAHSSAFKQNLSVFTHLSVILERLNLKDEQSQFLTCYFQVAKFGLLAANALIDKTSIYQGVLTDYQHANNKRDVALSENEMKDYLQTQFSRFQVVAEYAHPYMQGFTQSENEFRNHPLVASWKKNFEDLTNYQFKKISNIEQVNRLYEQLNNYYKTGRCIKFQPIELTEKEGFFVDLKHALYKELELNCQV